MHERFSTMLQRAREHENRDELVHVTGELLKSLAAEIEALEKAIAGMERDER